MEKQSHQEEKKNQDKKSLWQYIWRAHKRDTPESDDPTGRRDFLQKLGASFAGVMMPDVLKNAGVPQGERKELQPTFDATALFDYTFIDIEGYIAKITNTGDLPVDMKVGSTEQFKKLSTDYFMADSSEIKKIAILTTFLKDLRGQGDKLSKLFVDMSKENAHPIEAPVITPMEDATQFHFTYDDLKNITLIRDLDPQRIVHMLRRETPRSRSSKNLIIQLSVPVGKSEVKYSYRWPKTLEATLYDDPDGKVMYAIGTKAADASIGGKFVPVDAHGIALEIVTEAEYQRLNTQYQEVSTNEYKRTGKSDGIETIKSTVGDDENVDSYIVEKTDAYSEKLAKQNLEKLIALANEFPDRTFLCAAGDNSENFYGVRQELTDSLGWPDNLVLVGVREEIHGGVDADGCDIYLDSRGFSDMNGDDPIGSAEATAILASVADTLNSMLSQETPDKMARSKKIRDMIRNAFSKESTYSFYEKDEKVTRPCRVFVPGLMKKRVEAQQQKE